MRLHIMKMRPAVSIFPLIQFLPRPCIAQSLPIHGPGGLIPDNGQQFLSTGKPPVLYKTIRIARMSDVQSLHYLVATYIENPSHAESVVEVILNSDDWGRSFSLSSCWLDMAKDEEQKRKMILEDNQRRKLTAIDTSPVGDEAHEAIKTYVRNLSLGEKTTTTMLRSLDWKQADSREDVNTVDLKMRDRAEEEQENEVYQDYALTASALILSLCKNITTLRISGSGILGTLNEFLLKNNYNLLSQTALQKLQHIEILTGESTSDDERVYGQVEFLEYFQYFHRLPAVREIAVDGVQEYQANRGMFMPGTGTMKKIRIEHADISSGMLHTIITIPSKLEEFKLSLGGLWSTDGGLPMMIPRTLGQALVQHRKTLCVLDLDIDYALHDGGFLSRYETSDEEVELTGWYLKYEEEAYGHDYLQIDKALSKELEWGDRDVPESREYGYTIASLHDFTALTDLSISIKALMGPSEQSYEAPFRLAQQPPFRLVDALPPNLESLCLYGYTRGFNEDIDGQVEELLREKDEKLPLLKTIKGVEEMVLSLGSLYSDDTAEEDLWERPKREFHWVEV